MDANAFTPGMRVHYYPEKKSADDNRHFAAIILGRSANGAIRIEYRLLEEGVERVRRASVAARRLLVGQEELA